ncbi:hypothetical protein ELK40_15130 [Enterobacter sp. N18-03635]|uniref:MBL fold metallo-hydrolase n=1 Tax=Enterobacter sp. N18-03635 TaxID=2500132 RepID=UPI000FDB17E4|nr:MBL fold metallo-hydrolase [Enterobacter sp. N18-03635]AZV06404.1 hypothetical protein ELK40_15130 [Enterobacter sp. N18-03635]
MVEFYQGQTIAFRLLYDGGPSLSPELVKHLKGHPRDVGAPSLDIVVLSHVDYDHRAGLHTLLKNTNITIGEMWLPCLPAFQRLTTLFPARVQQGILQALKLQEEAQKRSIPVVYPLEDHVFRAGKHSALSVTVISPARRLMRELYRASANRLQMLLTHDPLPLEWLIRSEPDEEEDNDFEQTALFTTRSLLTPAELPASRVPLTLPQVIFDEIVAFQRKYNDPNFFGNPVLNDTSLILVIDAVLDRSHRRRIVLTGDQENWSWISSEHPMGLSADVMKAPHHGGKIYLSDKGDGISDVSQFWIWTHPRIVTVSANGRYNLPHNQFRDALRMTGATLVCPNKRQKEWIFSDTDTVVPKSCAEYYNCSKKQHPVLVLSLSAKSENLSAAACLSGNGHRGPSPIVVMQQKLIEPDESFVRWTQTEVRKNAEWLKEILVKSRQDELAALNDWIRMNTLFNARGLIEILNEAAAKDKSALIFDPTPVLRYGAAQGLLWLNEQSYSRYTMHSDTGVTAPLEEKEYKLLLKRILSFSHLFFLMDDIEQLTLLTKNRYQALLQADLNALEVLSAGCVGLPVEIFKRHVKPSLLHDLSSCYHFRIANASGHPFSYGPKVLHLYKKSPTVTSAEFIPHKWLNINHSESKAYDFTLDESSAAFIFDNPSQQVLPPLSFKYSRYEIAMESLVGFREWENDELRYNPNISRLQWHDL